MKEKNLSKGFLFQITINAFFNNLIHCNMNKMLFSGAMQCCPQTPSIFNLILNVPDNSAIDFYISFLSLFF